MIDPTAPNTPRTAGPVESLGSLGPLHSVRRMGPPGRLAAGLRRAAAIAVRRPCAALWTTLALACALLVVGAAALAATSVDRWAAAHPGAGASMVVYLADGVDPARAAALVRELGSLRGVEHAELVSAQDSAGRLVRALGSDPALLDGVDLASLPASVEVRLAPGVREVVAMSPTLRALRGDPAVADVVVEDGGGDPLAGPLAAARRIAWIAAAVFAGLALVIALAAVRLGLERPEREAAVLALLGAPAGFSALPSAVAGALYGATAAAIAALALGLAMQGLGAPLAALLGAPLAAFEPTVTPAAALGGLGALGALLGLAGGGLAGVARAR